MGLWRFYLGVAEIFCFFGIFVYLFFIVYENGFGVQFVITTMAVCLFAVQNTVPTLWAGTNNGTVYVFTIAIPSAAKRMEDAVSTDIPSDLQSNNST